MTERERQKTIEVFLALSDYKEAAEFEARVAAKLAQGFPNRECINWETGYECPGWRVCKRCRTAYPSCAFTALKGARLAVEEEMDDGTR